MTHILKTMCPTQGDPITRMHHSLTWSGFTAALVLALALVLACAAGKPVCAQAPAADSPEMRFFEIEVRPLLAQHCWSCHGEEKQKGGLRLDSHAESLAGGESGPAVTPGNLTDSLLIEAIRYEGLEMPPAKQLDSKSIDVLERWVQMGAPWPAEDPNRPARDPSAKITDEDRQWWAFQPIEDPTPPDLSELTGITSHWQQSPIDAFILTAMDAKGLRPAPPADRHSLIRRVYFDMLGVPPTPEEIDQFVADESADAYDQLITRVLADQRYGKRWAQHWLDLVRYADSDGYRADGYRPDAWHYRDYVIDALNADKPYDRFVQEQIAGDELFPDSLEAKWATGYLRNWIYEYNLRDARGQWNTILSDVTDNAGDVFLGMGMQCAKCHDHKFDPILQRDYYRLRAFFEPMLPVTQVVATAEAQAAYAEALKEWETATAELRQQIADIEAPYRERAAETAITRFPPDIEAMIRKPVAERLPEEHQLAELAYRQVDYEFDRIDSKIKGEDKEKWSALKAELAKFDKLKPTPLPQGMFVIDVSATPPPTFIPGKKKEAVQPGFLTILDPENATIEPPKDAPNPTTGRRSSLARWLTRPDNPLSTRVIVNRVWQYHFGRGIAPNSSDFGHLAGEPSHPALLDWLTSRFLEDGWSLKKLHRRILTSAVYQQATSHQQFDEFATIDPHNEFYWRADTRRLDAEQIRDAVLAVSGELQPRDGGEGFSGDKPYRSVYRRIMRNTRDPFLDVFDLPLFFNSEAARNTTTTPLQSLMLINSQKMLGHAGKLAEALAAQSESDEARIDALWRRLLGRAPSADELAGAREYLAAATQLAEADNDQHRQANNDIVTTTFSSSLGEAFDVDPKREKIGLQIPLGSSWPTTNFTIEAYFRVRSIYESGAVRTIASQRAGTSNGWAFGVTGEGSRKKPRTMVIQLWGTKSDGTSGEEALFSGADLELNHDYYAAVSIRLADEQAGTATFYLQDLTVQDAPLQVITIAHQMRSGIASEANLVIGGREQGSVNLFDGLIDDVRISSQVPAPDRLLVNRLTSGLPATTAVATDGGAEGNDQPAASTVADASADPRPLNDSVVADGFWRFERQANWRTDHSGNDRHILAPGQLLPLPSPAHSAWVDLCHALLNSNEFLYVD